MVYKQKKNKLGIMLKKESVKCCGSEDSVRQDHELQTGNQRADVECCAYAAQTGRQ